MTQNTTDRLLTDKANLGASRLQGETMADAAQGEVLLALDTFALTTNNITYAAFGDAMNYWSFFPTDEEGWGHMPVWGFATVMQSRVEGVAVGERFYGYFPMASLLRVQPDRITDRGFYDIAVHRQGLPSPYNQYTRCQTDEAYVPELADFQMLLRPLFFTSYMLADYLADNAYFGARQVVFSSASSKTAYGTAYAQADGPCGASGEAPQCIGLTSAHHREYVAGLGLYDQVTDYDGLEQLDASVPTLYVDFSGSDALRERVRAHFGASLVHDCFAGSATNTDYLDETRWSDPVPQSFFAPIQIRKRNQDWGAPTLSRRFGAVQRRFLRAVSDPSNGWMTLRVHQGLEAARAVVEDLYLNCGQPREGHVVRLQRQDASGADQLS